MTTAYPVNGGDFTFSWSYELQDSLTGFDPFVFVSDLLVGVSGLQVVADGSGAMAGSAFFSLTENAIWGFAVRSLDGTFGPGIATISKLSLAPGQIPSVPLPPAILLFGDALAGLGFVRKKKQVV